MNVDNREVVTLSFCDTPEGKAESSRCAAEYTLRNPLVYELGRPEVTECEVLTHLESSQETGSGEGTNGEDAMAAAIALWLKESRGMLLAIPEQ